MFFVSLTSATVSLRPLPHLHFLVNGGITSVALLSVKRSRMVKPLSAIISSPARILSRNPEFSVMNLSDVLPPHESDIKEKSPEGVITH